MKTHPDAHHAFKKKKKQQKPMTPGPRVPFGLKNDTRYSDTIPLTGENKRRKKTLLFIQENGLNIEMVASYFSRFFSRFLFNAIP